VKKNGHRVILASLELRNRRRKGHHGGRRQHDLPKTINIQQRPMWARALWFIFGVLAGGDATGKGARGHWEISAGPAECRVGLYRPIAASV